MNNTKAIPLSSDPIVEEGNSQLDRETRRLEVRVRRKTDLAILPLLCSVFFLAQMVRKASIYNGNC